MPWVIVSDKNSLRCWFLLNEKLVAPTCSLFRQSRSQLILLPCRSNSNNYTIFLISLLGTRQTNGINVINGGVELAFGGWPLLGDNPGGKFNADNFDMTALMTGLFVGAGSTSIIRATAKKYQDRFQLEVGVTGCLPLTVWQQPIRHSDSRFDISTSSFKHFSNFFSTSNKNVDTSMSIFLLAWLVSWSRLYPHDQP